MSNLTFNQQQPSIDLRGVRRFCGGLQPFADVCTIPQLIHVVLLVKTHQGPLVGIDRLRNAYCEISLHTFFLNVDNGVAILIATIFDEFFSIVLEDLTIMRNIKVGKRFGSDSLFVNENGRNVQSVLFCFQITFLRIVLIADVPKLQSKF